MNYLPKNRLLNQTDVFENCEGIQDALHVIATEGNHLWKGRSPSKWFRKNFDISVVDMRINYSPSTKSGCLCTATEECSIAIPDIQEVRSGWSTRLFKNVEAQQKKSRRRRGHPEIEECRCFSIIYGERGSQTLDLVAPSSEVAEAWITAIEQLLSWHELTLMERGYELWLRKKFKSADRDNNKCLNFKETQKLLNDLNIDVTKEEAFRLFASANSKLIITRKTKEVLTEDEFLVLYFMLLERREVQDIFKSYIAPNGTFTATQLQDFLQREQQGFENISKEDCEKLLQKYEQSDAKVKSQMTPAGFQNMLLSPDFDIFNYSEHNNVFQDMSQPLSHYYIASSHNTYIIGNQLSGEAKTEAYIESLKRGCKCVEIDCWDGEDGEPIVWHGRTLVSKIPLRVVLEDAIKPYAFVTSKFPLILSLENHCSASVRRKISAYLTEILGDMLYTSDSLETMEHLPSPKQLEGKVLIKAKLLSSKDKKQKKRPMSSDSSKSNTNFYVKEEFVSYDNGQTNKVTRVVSSEISELHGAYTSRDGSGSSSNVEWYTRPTSNGSRISDALEEEESDDDEMEESLSEIQTASVPEPDSFRIPALLQAVKFSSFATPRRCYEMSSFSEAKALKFAKENTIDFVNYNQRQLSRIYPSAMRATSSNFIPTDFWRVGCQLVALNYQTRDFANLVNAAMFKQNGNCGYVLKPKLLRNSTAGMTRKLLFKKTCRLNLRIISGQHLPKAEGDSEVVDPYVEFSVFGGGVDYDSRTKFTTKRVQNNGFNPIWNETLEVVVKCPELSFVFFRVRDYAQSGSDVALGYYVAPFGAIRTGYHHIRLQNIGGELIPPSTLFVHIGIKEVSTE